MQETYDQSEASFSYSLIVTIGQVWECWPGKNTLAYLYILLVTKNSAFQKWALGDNTLNI